MHRAFPPTPFHSPEPSRFFRPHRRVFAFNLDGTLTSREILPEIAACAGLEKKLTDLTHRTLKGEIDFELSFRKRFAMLRHIPLSVVQDVVASIPLDPHIASFIKKRNDECVIVTGNLDLWIRPILSRLGCRYFASQGKIVDGKLEIESVLDKGNTANQMKIQRKYIVAVGESINDLPLFQNSDVSIAFSGVHAAIPEIVACAQYHARDGADLCRLLQSL